MASITKRPSGKWRARYRDHSGREHARHFDRKVDAQRWLDSITVELQSGSWVDPDRSKMPMSVYADEWIARKLALKPSTGRRYRGIVENHIKPGFGGIPLGKMTREQVIGWIADLDNWQAGSTVRQEHRVLSMILDEAVRDRRIGHNPAVGIDLPRAGKKRKMYLGHRQVHALADEAGRDRLIILVLAYCGIRFGELAALRVWDVDVPRRRLTIAEATTELGGKLVTDTPKSHRQRWVPVPPSVITELSDLRKGREPDAMLFTAAEGGPLRLRNWRRDVFDPAATAVGLPDLTPHDLRHTAVSLAVQAGANLKAIQRMLGHSSAAMTFDVYADLFEDDDLDRVAVQVDRIARKSLDHSPRTVRKTTENDGSGPSPTNAID